MLLSRLSQNSPPVDAEAPKLGQQYQKPRLTVVVTELPRDDDEDLPEFTRVFREMTRRGWRG